MCGAVHSPCRRCRRFHDGLAFAAFFFAVAALVLLSVKPFLELEWFSWKLVCSRTGPFAGTCHAEPTVRERFGMSGASFDWQSPRPYFMPMLEVDELARAEVSEYSAACVVLFTKHGHGSVNEMGNGWYYVPVVLNGCDHNGIVDPATRADTERLAADFNDFLRSGRAELRHHPAAELHGSWLWLAWASRIVGVALVLLAGAALVRAVRRARAHSQ